jgi:probable phosphoglycerate mutase
MELLLVRHALPVRREVRDGPADPELAPEGREQSRHLAQYLASERLDAVYASPLRRAWQTAEPVASAQRVDVVPADELVEWDQNSPEYVPVEELKAAGDPRWHAMVAGEWEGEEAPEAFRARVVGCLEELIATHRGDRIAAVCHGGVINCYLAHVLELGEGVTRMQFFYPNYTSIHRVAASSAGHRSIMTINETSHLRGTGLPMGLLQSG